jgi:hypothetical protein
VQSARRVDGVRRRLRSQRRLSAHSKVVVRVRISGRSARMTVPLGKRTKVLLKRH